MGRSTVAEGERLKLFKYR